MRITDQTPVLHVPPSMVRQRIYALLDQVRRFNPMCTATKDEQPEIYAMSNPTYGKDFMKKFRVKYCVGSKTEILVNTVLCATPVDAWVTIVRLHAATNQNASQMISIEELP